ncbi:MAG: response regulator [Eubacteriales bacterium]|nr:response regulator [Eubacteriales bacterium]
MNLLLVDDETVTREGILSIIPLEELGIDQVITAKNGKDGLSKVLSFSPDIILTDVKMPQMDGVSMSFELRKNFPDCSIIFMSGYADKEYLKSAIRLSAVNYIEKPFAPEELISTLRIAVQKCREKQALAHSADEISRQLDMSLPELQNKAALSLTVPPSLASRHIQEILSVASPDLETSGAWVSILIRFITSASITVSRQDALRSLLTNALQTNSFSEFLIGWKNDSLSVVQIRLGSLVDISALRDQIVSLCQILQDTLTASCPFLIAAGNPVQSILQLFLSYQSAAICLERGFFRAENSSLFSWEDSGSRSYQFSPDTLLPFEKAVRHQDETAAFSYIHDLIEKLRQFDGTLPSTVKHFFIQAMLFLYDTDRLCKGRAFLPDETPETIRDSFWKITFLNEIEAELEKRLTTFFLSTDSSFSQNALAYQIRLFLEENYEKEGLSLQEISETFSVSESYLCILYKKAFDTTINQYLIDLRIAKAKEYLLETNKKIKEIASLIGYRDCNYFIRIFKKNVGQTPADFRNLM